MYIYNNRYSSENEILNGFYFAFVYIFIQGQFNIVEEKCTGTMFSYAIFLRKPSSFWI